MTPEQRQQLIDRHDSLIAVYNDSEDERVLEEIGVLEFMLFYDPDAPLHTCDEDDCLICSF
jgi:hypothetical protein